MAQVDYLKHKKELGQKGKGKGTFLAGSRLEETYTCRLCGSRLKISQQFLESLFVYCSNQKFSLMGNFPVIDSIIPDSLPHSLFFNTPNLKISQFDFQVVGFLFGKRERNGSQRHRQHEQQRQQISLR